MINAVTSKAFEDRESDKNGTIKKIAIQGKKEAIIITRPNLRMADFTW